MTEENDMEEDDENVSIVNVYEDDSNEGKCHYLDAFCRLEVKDDFLVSQYDIVTLSKSIFPMIFKGGSRWMELA